MESTLGEFESDQISAALALGDCESDGSVTSATSSLGNFEPDKDEVSSASALGNFESDRDEYQRHYPFAILSPMR